MNIVCTLFGHNWVPIPKAPMPMGFPTQAYPGIPKKKEYYCSRCKIRKGNKGTAKTIATTLILLVILYLAVLLT